MTQGVRSRGDVKSRQLSGKRKRKVPAAILDVRSKILELRKQRMSARQISRVVNLGRNAVLAHLKVLSQDPANGITYNYATKREDTRWYKIIERVRNELGWYKSKGLYPPTLRKIYYRLIELGILTKGKEDYDKLSRNTAEARRGVHSTFTRRSTLPKLPIDCFRDENRITIGETDMNNEPEDPTPDEPPEDPIEATENAIENLKKTVFEYDGSCTEGSPGVKPGRWYKQPNYVEIWVESGTLQEDLLQFQGDRKVKVFASRGFSSVSYLYETCKRLRNIQFSNIHIKRIIILYLGDYDKAGEDIAQNLENALTYNMKEPMTNEI